MKAALTLQQKQATPNAELKKLNHRIEAVIKRCKVHFPTAVEALQSFSPTPRETLFAGVSSFRYAGTIAHAVLSQPLVEQGPLENRTQALDTVLPDQQTIPWGRPPHPLLQRSMAIAERGVEHTATFHTTLMELYEDHVIEGRCIFPGAGFVEMTVAVPRQSEHAEGLELQDMVFLVPFDVVPGGDLKCEHTFGSLMHCLTQKQSIAHIQNVQNSCTTSSSADLPFPGDRELKVVAHADIGVLWKKNKKYKQQ